MSIPKPIMLLILDGWGLGPDSADNAIARATTPHWDRLVAEQPICRLITHGLAVGLPEGQMGNSEVGHMNIGAGRVVYQDLTRITQAIEDQSFATNPNLLASMAEAKAKHSTLHLFALLSPGGVHSHETHLFATIDLALAQGLKNIALHLFTDGRDVAPRCALDSAARLQPWLNHPEVRVASVCGRYFAMDRDRRFERTQKAWQAMALASADQQATHLDEAIHQAYQRGEDDEFIEPTVIDGGCPFGADDVGIFINFRSDRARQLAHALIDQDFDDFERPHERRLAHLTTMTRYADDLPCPVAFAPQNLDHVLGEVVADAGLSQLRIAETEKYAHVTYFFNGGRDAVFQSESRVLIPSPKVATYDLKPEMSSKELASALEEAIASQSHDLIIANVANPDMVGHTGDLQAAMMAVEAVDQLLGRVLTALDQVGGEVIVTADHGNAEQMKDPATGQAHTAHTTNLVPLIYHGPRTWTLADQGSLKDIAPTLLTLLGIKPPPEMTGKPLLAPRSLS